MTPSSALKRSPSSSSITKLQTLLSSNKPMTENIKTQKSPFQLIISHDDVKIYTKTVTNNNVKTVVKSTPKKCNYCSPSSEPNKPQEKFDKSKYKYVASNHKNLDKSTL